MKEHILPIETNPPYKSFQEPAFFLGILLTNPQYINKFYNGYINLKYDANLLWLNMCYPKYNWYTYDECDMDIESLVIKGNPYIVGKKDPYDHIMELMKNALLRGYYVNGFCDEFYISNKKNFRRIHNFHDFLLFGLCEDLPYLSKAYFENDVSCYLEEDGDIIGLLLFHKKPSGTLEVVIMQVLGNEHVKDLLSMMCQALSAAKEIYDQQTEICIDRHNYSTLALSEKLFPRGFGIPVYTGSRNER